ncbi:hypothetical protein [Spirosoma endophyticum]|uniref:Uncharacterized protein n=1 Tax=Spirosoma endophyticum TaxID=662367 RepID=A0A1I2HAF7_9BACT|nr:hypothetical protein [Spirosoma endophyticum]SFF25736.1 hypothetical protein SAMN05216167_1397 [Spirosoma endophyticum]
MKTLDPISKRILVVALSISLVLLSLSAFLLTISRVTAKPTEGVYENIIGLGVDEESAYYADLGQLKIYKIPKSKAQPVTRWK